MGIRERFWNWCPKPERAASTKFARPATPPFVSVLIGGLLLTAFATVVLLPPMVFRSTCDESGWVIDQEIERVQFPGGFMVVYRRRWDPHSESHIVVKTYPNIKSESDLRAYVESRRNAMEELLNSVSPNETLTVTLTFNTPLEPTYFQDLCVDYLDKPNLYAILLRNETSGTVGATISGPHPLEASFVKDFTYLRADYNLLGVIASEALLRAGMVKTMQSDSRVLLVDPAEDLTTQKLVEKHLSSGLHASGYVEEILFPSKIWSQYVKLKHGVTWITEFNVFEPELGTTFLRIDELLVNPSKYHRHRIHVFGTVGDLSLLGEPYLQLDGKLLVCYRYEDADLYPTQIKDEIHNGDYASVIGRFFYEEPIEGYCSILYAEKIEKAEPQPPKPPSEAYLVITLDKEIYHQGEIRNITIKNISNETIWFTDTAHNLFFDRFNGVDWEFHDAMIGGLMMTPLEPGKTAWHTWPVGYAGCPYPPGRYRVGTHGVYAEFEVSDVPPDLAEKLKQADLKLKEKGMKSSSVVCP